VGSDITLNSRRVENLTSGLTYEFKVRAKNACGSGEYSSPLMVLIPSAPSGMPPVQITQEQGC
jgi:hypothetical protein